MKKRVCITMTEENIKKVKEMSKIQGMDVSNYIAHLIICDYYEYQTYRMEQEFQEAKNKDFNQLSWYDKDPPD